MQYDKISKYVRITKNTIIQDGQRIDEEQTERLTKDIDAS